MRLNRWERLLVNSWPRTLSPRYFEGPLLRKIGGGVEGGQVLEVGCGRGVGIELLLQQFRAAHVCGIDLDRQQIDRARKRLSHKHSSRVTLAVASADSLPFFDARFDAVFDFGVLHHLPVWQAGVAEICRVLKAGGIFFFEEVTGMALERRLYRALLEHPVENRFSEAQFLAELANCGLQLKAEPRQVLFGDIFIGAAHKDWGQAPLSPIKQLMRTTHTTT